jgi:hypothetical protein
MLRTHRARLLARPRVATTAVTGAGDAGGRRTGRSGPSWAVSARPTASAEAWPWSSRTVAIPTGTSPTITSSRAAT